MIKKKSHMLRIDDYRTGALLLMTCTESTIHEVTFYDNDYDEKKVIDELTDMLSLYLIKPEYL